MWNYAENRSIAYHPIACVDLNIRDTTKVEKRPFYRSSMLERTNNGKCIANGTACDRGFCMDMIRVRLCATLVRVYASSWPESHGGYSVYYIRNRESFARRKEGKPVVRDAIYAKHYCSDKAMRFCSHTSAAARQYGMNIYLSAHFTRYDYRTKKAERVRERIERAVRLLTLKNT